MAGLMYLSERAQLLTPNSQQTGVCVLFDMTGSQAYGSFFLRKHARTFDAQFQIVPWHMTRNENTGILKQYLA